MTIDLKDKTVAEIIKDGKDSMGSFGYWRRATNALASRLKENQERIADLEHQLAEAKAEAKHAWEAGAKHEAMCRSEEIKALKAEIKAMRPMREGTASEIIALRFCGSVSLAGLVEAACAGGSSERAVRGWFQRRRCDVFECR